ncbi:MAG TPA: WecB/TagA/CpsF family glycosyltransferase [Glaciibacter sp.]|nr:WecB/TagA/CpsF family glycosyltransferase [Glaciibacter sp.]
MTSEATSIVLGGSIVDLREFREAVDYISERSRSESAAPLAVTSVNLDHIHHFGNGSRWTGALDSVPDHLPGHSGGMEWLNLVDGAPLVSQARRLTGRPWPRLAGSDLIGPLLAEAERSGARIGFLGGAPSTHDQLRSHLPAAHPSLQVSGYWAPAREDLWDSGRSSALAQEIAEARTDILIVGLGKPRQELWIAEHGMKTNAKVFLAFGAVVDFLAGRVRRAPSWVSSHGLEWAWRLAMEPRRLASRYLVEDPPAYLAVRRRERARVPAPQQPAFIASTALAGSRENGFLDEGGRAHVAVIIVSANSAQQIAALLESLRLEASDMILRVLVVYNDSQEEIKDLLSRQSDVIVVRDDGRRGRAGGINAARKHIGDAGTVLILNADRVIERGTLRAMLRTMSRTGAGAVVPRLLDPDGTTYRSLRREPTLRRALFDAFFGAHDNRRPLGLSEFEADPESYEHAHQVEWAGGTSLLVRRDVYDAVGDWDERFYRYSDETDYLRRVREVGATVWYEPKARMRRTPAPTPSPAFAALLAVNRIRYSQKHHSWLYALIFHLLVAIHEVLRVKDPVHRHILGVLLNQPGWRHLPQSAPPVARTSPIAPALPTVPLDRPAGSIIIPANNEESVIARTLETLSHLVQMNYAEVIVVCNGCMDATAARARDFAGVHVIEIDRASKTAALNAGDAVASAWPRLYLDADVQIDPSAVMAVFETLDSPTVLAARPAYEYDDTGASAIVRSYYRARSRIYPAHGALWGSGAYAVNAVGHDRFTEFPDLTADDLYIDARFRQHEKRVVPTVPVRVRTPRSTAGLLAILTRQRRGKVESGTVPTTAESVRSVFSTLRGPSSALDAATYLALTAVGRVRARRAHTAWERDSSSRSAASHSHV